MGELLAKKHPSRNYSKKAKLLLNHCQLKRSAKRKTGKRDHIVPLLLRHLVAVHLNSHRARNLNLSERDIRDAIIIIINLVEEKIAEKGGIIIEGAEEMSAEGVGADEYHIFEYIALINSLKLE